jgi:hypothetical protein
MAADFITVDRSKQLGNKLVRAAELFRELRELVDCISDAKDHSFDGADFSLMETNFGLDTGVGGNTATLIGYMNEILNTETTVAGDVRKARIDEFCARLAGQ